MVGHELLSLYKIATQPRRNRAFQTDGSKEPQAKRSPLTISRPIRYPSAFVKAEARKMESEANAINYHHRHIIAFLRSKEFFLPANTRIDACGDACPKCPIDIKLTEFRLDVACRETAGKLRATRDASRITQSTTKETLRRASRRQNYSTPSRSSPTPYRTRLTVPISPKFSRIPP